MEEVDWHFSLAKERFANEVAERSIRHAHANRFEELLIVAPPKLLGILASPSRGGRDLIAAEIPEDLTTHPCQRSRSLSPLSDRGCRPACNLRRGLSSEAFDSLQRFIADDRSRMSRLPTIQPAAGARTRQNGAFGNFHEISGNVRRGFNSILKVKLAAMILLCRS